VWVRLGVVGRGGLDAAGCVRSRFVEFRYGMLSSGQVR